MIDFTEEEWEQIGDWVAPTFESAMQNYDYYDPEAQELVELANKLVRATSSRELSNAISRHLAGIKSARSTH